MAGDPAQAAVLLGLGVDELSVNAMAVPRIKESIRAIRLSDARDLAAELLELPTAEDALRFARERLHASDGAQRSSEAG